jgi:hypothetical protein
VIKMTVPKLPALDIQLLIEYARGDAHDLCDPTENADRVSEWLTAVAAERNQETPVTTESESEISQFGTLVARNVGLLETGRVTEPTAADAERAACVHGSTGLAAPLDSPGCLVLIRWESGSRSWEYCEDLRVIPESAKG